MVEYGSLLSIFSTHHWGLKIGYLLKWAELPRSSGGNMIGHIGENAIVRWDWYLYGNGGYDKGNRCSQIDLYIGGHKAIIDCNM